MAESESELGRAAVGCATVLVVVAGAGGSAYAGSVGVSAAARLAVAFVTGAVAGVGSLGAMSTPRLWLRAGISILVLCLVAGFCFWFSVVATPH